jgi:peptide/nickel transport system substrate-binding protein
VSTIPSRRRALGIAFASLATAAALVLSGCSSSEPAASTSTDDGSPDVLRVVSVAPPVSLDPYLQNVDPVNIWFIALAYDPLIRVDGEGNFVPDLATEWEYIDDEATQLEVTLREGVKFSDGSDMTAEGVAASLTYAIESGVNGAAWLGSGTTVEATGDDTIVITSATSNPSIPQLLTQRVLLGSVISEEALADPGVLLNGTYGAGPYVLDAEATVADSSYVYTPNEYYWDPEKIKWDRIEIDIVANTAAALQAVQSGQADLFRGDTATGESALAAGLEVEATPLGLLGMNYIDYNGEIAPALADVRVRQALNYAIDRDSIAEAVFGQWGTAGGALALADTIGFDAETQDTYEYDPEKARELLAEAGYEDGFSVDVAYVTSISSDVLVQAVAANWAEIGVTANLVNFTDAGQAVSEITARKYPIAYYGSGQLPPYIVARSFFGGDANQYNPWQSTDAELAEILEEASQAADDETADELYAAAFERAYADLALQGGVVNSAQVFIYNPETITSVYATTNCPTPDIAWEVAPAE